MSFGEEPYPGVDVALAAKEQEEGERKDSSLRGDQTGDANGSSTGAWSSPRALPGPSRGSGLAGLSWLLLHDVGVQCALGTNPLSILPTGPMHQSDHLLGGDHGVEEMPMGF